MPNEAPYFSDRPFLTNEEVNDAESNADTFTRLTATTENAVAGQDALTKPEGNPGDPRTKTTDVFEIDQS